MIIDQDDDIPDSSLGAEDDARNDDTFGSTAEVNDSSSLPNFFQHHGTTVLEELGQLEEDPDDDILYDADAIETGLSDFFKPDHGNIPNSVYDSWMGAATGEDTLQPPDDDPLEKELEVAQKELERFSLDAAMLDEPYEASAVTISLPPAAPVSNQSSTVDSYKTSQPLNKVKHLSGAELNSFLSGNNISSLSLSDPPIAASLSGPSTGSPAIAASLSGPTPVVPKPPSSTGPWNKPLPDFSDPPISARSSRKASSAGRGRGAKKPGDDYQPRRYEGRGAPPPRGPPFAEGSNGPRSGRENTPVGFGPPSIPGGPPPFPGAPPSFFGAPSAFPGGMSMVPPPRPPPLPHGEKMNSGEVRFVLSKVLGPLKMEDPYCDDFYSIQLAVKKHNEKAAAAAVSNEDTPPPLNVPLPIWKIAKERLLKQLESSKREQMERTLVWEKKENVLGHVTRLDFTRPRRLLSLSPEDESEVTQDDSSQSPVGDDVKLCYGTVLWNMRAAVSRGFKALYTVQELHQLLNTPMIAANPEARADILNEVSSALALLSRSVGILPHNAPVVLEDSSSPQSASDVVLEGGLVAALLQTIKGKKLISRSMRHLTTTQRWALTPVILARTLQNVCTKGSEEEAVEQRLMKVLVQFVQNEFNLSEENMGLGRIEFSVNLLKNLRQCVRTVMVAQMEKSRLREALLSSRCRAEVMHNIIQVGDKIAKALSAKNDVAVQWSEIREAFMSMLDN